MNRNKNNLELYAIAEKLKAIASNGLTYCKNEYDKERYTELQAISAKLISNLSNISYDKILTICLNDKGYTTPKIDVRGAIFDGSKILLTKETSDNLWSLPGGWADINESASEAIIREIKEETGYTVTINKFAALWDKHKHNHPYQIPHAYKAVFICEITGGDFKKNHEISNIGWFNVHDLPELSLHRVTPLQINKLFQIHNNQNYHTEFD